MLNVRLNEAQDGMKIARRGINKFRYADNIMLKAESIKKLKTILMRVKEDSYKAGLKLNIQKMKIMASGPITSRQTDGQIVETVPNFIFLGSKITVDGDCSHENQKTLALWNKSYDQPRQHIRKQRNYFASKGLSRQGNGFSSSHVWF